MAQIKHKDTGEVLFELDGYSLKKSILIAIKDGVNLSGANLRGINLRAENLQRARFMGADLSYADLYGVNLSHADLSYTDLSGSYLTNADLTNADLLNADLGGAKLYEANFSDANLGGAVMYRSILDGAKFNRTILTATDLSGAIFTNIEFKDTTFNSAELNNTTFGLSDLSKCLNLDKTLVSGKCTIDFETLKNSPNLPHTFLHKLGISEQALDYVHDLTNTSPIKMFPVFLSHSWTNKEFARKLYESLSDHKVHCWLDEKKTKPGDRIISAITKGIESYDKMILVCSKESLTSWWVEREIERILNKEREYNHEKKEKEKVNLLIPITIDDYVFEEWDSPWATEIRRYIIGDFREWKNNEAYEKKLKNLIEGIRVDPIDFNPTSFLPSK